MQRPFLARRENLPIDGPVLLDLPRLVMRYALAVALLALLLAALLGVLEADEDLRLEADAAVTLASTMARLANLVEMDDREALAALGDTRRAHPMRHLELRVVGSDGSVLLAPPVAQPVGAPLSWWVAAHRALHDAPEAQRVSWTVPRPDGRVWTVALAVTHESERVEAVSGWLSMLLLLAGSIVLMLAVMAWSVRRSLAPLQGVLAAIGALQRGDAGAVKHLEPMPIRELEAIRQALKSLVDSLEHTEAARRVLGQKLITLQEDERAALARELHDELGQRLTALRVDAHWLQRQAETRPAMLPLQPVLQSLSQRCAEMQSDIRQLLVRLRPLGPEGDEAESDHSVAGLGDMLQWLADDWSQGSTRSVEFEVRLNANDPGRLLPRSLALGVYRISQEALTNAVRHAGAGRVELGITVEDDALVWSVRDDGVGIADLGAALRTGNGLGGMRERIWALGGELLQCPCERGLMLRARLPLDAQTPRTP